MTSWLLLGQEGDRISSSESQQGVKNLNLERQFSQFEEKSTKVECIVVAR